MGRAPETAKLEEQKWGYLFFAGRLLGIVTQITRRQISASRASDNATPKGSLAHLAVRIVGRGQMIVVAAQRHTISPQNGPTRLCRNRAFAYR
jgi:hypothetical protein